MLPFMTPFLSVLKLTRICPACGSKQVVSRDHKHTSVPCRTCGNPIPPKKS